MPLAALGQKTRPLASVGLTQPRGAKPGERQSKAPVVTSRTFKPPTVLAKASLGVSATELQA